MVYYYIAKNDAIKSTTSIVKARKGTIEHLFEYPNKEMSFITTTPKILLKDLIEYRKGMNYYPRDTTIVEYIYDDGVQWVTSKKTNGRWPMYAIKADGSLGKKLK